MIANKKYPGFQFTVKYKILKQVWRILLKQNIKPELKKKRKKKN